VVKELLVSVVVRWAVAAVVGSAFANIGCSAAPPAPRVELGDQRPIVADESLVHALDTRLETHLVDQLELDSFLKDRDIHVKVADGVVAITGEVWTPLEKERVGELVRRVAGVVDVSNELDVHQPR